ncbi:hypothetical protein Sjap_015541 [Stephania japonica]|uniref:Uncharacterized protein n=1 Tax=Stephania japonica TaxID=461633 RepID=A0AAP0IJB8_9MAGN
MSMQQEKSEGDLKGKLDEELGPKGVAQSSIAGEGDNSPAVAVAVAAAKKGRVERHLPQPPEPCLVATSRDFLS